MELLPTPFYVTFKRYWRRRRYQRLDNANSNRKPLKIARFGGSPRRFWRIKSVPKLRLKFISPLKLLNKIKNAYIDMMLNLAGNVGYLNSANVFGEKRIPKARQGRIVYSSNEVEGRLIYEIYKALIASRELAA